jgi:hypothetical protein
MAKLQGCYSKGISLSRLASRAGNRRLTFRISLAVHIFLYPHVMRSPRGKGASDGVGRGLGG